MSDTDKALPLTDEEVEILRAKMTGARDRVVQGGEYVAAALYAMPRLLATVEARTKERDALRARVEKLRVALLMIETGGYTRSKCNWCGVVSDSGTSHTIGCAALVARDAFDADASKRDGNKP